METLCSETLKIIHFLRTKHQPKPTGVLGETEIASPLLGLSASPFSLVAVFTAHLVYLLKMGLQTPSSPASPACTAPTPRKWGLYNLFSIVQTAEDSHVRAGELPGQNFKVFI